MAFKVAEPSLTSVPPVTVVVSELTSQVDPLAAVTVPGQRKWPRGGQRAGHITTPPSVTVPETTSDPVDNGAHPTDGQAARNVQGAFVAQGPD